MGRRRWQAKFMTSHCATGKMMKIRKQWPHSKCPRCGHAEEDTRHLCQCPHPEARAKLTKSLLELDKWMVTKDTMPQLRAHLLLLLRRWIANEPPPKGGTTATGRALQAQSTLGGWNTILGRISKRMTEAQNRHYHQKGSRRTGLRWTVALITKLQNTSWEMWQHRNDVKADNPTRHFLRDELAEANLAIAGEWTTGPVGLLSRDRFLFRSRTGVDEKTLPHKWEWLEFVTGARAAAAADAANKKSYEPERQGMRNFVLRNNNTNTNRARDGPQNTPLTLQPTPTQKIKQEPKETTKKPKKQTKTKKKTTRKTKKKRTAPNTRIFQRTADTTKRRRTTGGSEPSPSSPSHNLSS